MLESSSTIMTLGRESTTATDELRGNDSSGNGGMSGANKAFQGRVSQFFREFS